MTNDEIKEYLKMAEKDVESLIKDDLNSTANVNKLLFRAGTLIGLCQVLIERNELLEAKNV